MFEELFDRGGLSHERLFALVRLAEEGSLIRAANGDTGLQSRYSHSIKELSAYFGVELTERVGKSVRLTENGERLVMLAHDHFGNVLRFKQNARGVAPRFRLAAEESLLQFIAIPAIASSRRPNFRVRFSLHCVLGTEITHRLAEQRLDFGLLTQKHAPKGLKVTTIGKVKRIIVVPDQIGSRRGMLTLEEALLACPHACFSGDRSQRESIETIAKSLGGHFDPELECDSISQCVAAVTSGRFASILPQWAWNSGSLLPHSICDDSALEPLSENLVLMWNPRLTKTHGAVAKEAAQVLENRMREILMSDEAS